MSGYADPSRQFTCLGSREGVDVPRARAEVSGHSALQLQERNIYRQAETLVLRSVVSELDEPMGFSLS